MATSNSYTFGTNTEIDDLFRECFERIGIIGNEEVALKVQSAIMSANLELTAWQGKVPLAWTLKRFMCSLYVGQANYILPRTITRVVDVVATQPQRLNQNGTASSSAGGSAANCFDPTTSAGCVQTSPNGNIAYDYGIGNSQAVQYVGITPLDSQSEYTISVDYSFDNVNWFTSYQAPTQLYFANQIIWFVIENSINARAWRIREINNATLSIQQIYFNQPTNVGTGDRTLTPLSYTEWMQLPSKLSSGYPSSYFYNEQIKPILTLWPVLGPSSFQNQYTALLFTAYQYAQDVTLLFQQFDVPQRFYDALAAGITARLAMKFIPEQKDKINILKQEAQESFQTACLTEFQAVTLRFQPDSSSYYG